MNPLLPKQTPEFRAACARLRNFPEFKAIMAYIEQRHEYFQKMLTTVDEEAQLRVLQGRVRELEDLVAEIDKREP